MGIIGYLKVARAKTLDRNSSADHFTNKYYSGTSYALWREINYRIREHIRGRMLDAGCGRGGWKEVIESTGATRESLDIQQYGGAKLDWLADLTNMPQVPSEHFDSVTCNQVLEHVREPGAALHELCRVLKPGGKVVLSVPFLSRLHELPHDYFRYTPNGLRHLLEKSGFEVVSMGTYGGLLTFVHHQSSAVFLGLAAVARPVYYAALFLNAPLSFATCLFDRLLDSKHLMPNGVIAVAYKK